MFFHKIHATQSQGFLSLSLLPPTTLFDHGELEVGSCVVRFTAGHTRVSSTVVQTNSTQLQHGHGEHHSVLLHQLAVDGDVGVVVDGDSFKGPGDVWRRVGQPHAGEDGRVACYHLGVVGSNNNFSYRGRGRGVERRRRKRERER